MTATAVPRATPRRLSFADMKWNYPASGAILHGTLVGVDANGEVAEPAPGVKPVGRASVANCNAAVADEMVRIDQGIFCWAHTGLDKGDIGAIAFAVDNQTVALTSAAGEALGLIVDVDDEGAWVLGGFGVCPVLLGST